MSRSLERCRLRSWTCLCIAGAIIARWSSNPGCFAGLPNSAASQSALLCRGQSAGLDLEPDPTSVAAAKSSGSAVGNVQQAAQDQGGIDEASSKPPVAEPPSLAIGAAVGALVTGAAAVLGPMLVRSEPMAPLREGMASLVAPLSESYGIPIIMGMVPSWLLHWSHGGNTGAALLLVAGFGVAEGLRIRQRRFEGRSAGGPTLLDHRTMMASALIVSLVGASGGLAAIRFERQALLESPHAWAAITSVLLLLGNAIISATFAGGKPRDEQELTARSLHAQVGSAWMASVAATAAMGIGLGLSYDASAVFGADAGSAGPESVSASMLQFEQDV